MDDDLRALLERVLADIARSADAYLGQRLSRHEWARQMARTIGDGHRDAYRLGRDTKDMDPAARAFLAQAIADQVTYLTGFSQDLRREDMSAALMKARAALYAGALKGTYYRARFWPWDLPFVPTEGSECMVNCTCTIDVTEAGDGTGLMAWTLGEHAHAETCPTCLDRADKSPFSVKKRKVT